MKKTRRTAQTAEAVYMTVEENPPARREGLMSPLLSSREGREVHQRLCNLAQIRETHRTQKPRGVVCMDAMRGTHIRCPRCGTIDTGNHRCIHCGTSYLDPMDEEGIYGGRELSGGRIQCELCGCEEILFRCAHKNGRRIRNAFRCCGCGSRIYRTDRVKLDE